MNQPFKSVVTLFQKEYIPKKTGLGSQRLLFFEGRACKVKVRCMTVVTPDTSVSIDEVTDHD